MALVRLHRLSATPGGATTVGRDLGLLPLRRAQNQAPAEPGADGKAQVTG